MSKKESLQAALHEIQQRQGVSVRSVAKKYGVPPSTLYRHVQAESNVGSGRPTVLTPAEEKEIVYSCQVLQEMGFGMTREMVGAIVVDYLTTVGRDNPFNGQPGFKWWKGFQKRNPQLVDRKPQHFPKHRAIAGNELTIHSFIGKVRDLLQELKITDKSDLGDRLWNCDETGYALQLCPAQCLQGEVQSGSMRPLVDLDGR